MAALLTRASARTKRRSPGGVAGGVDGFGATARAAGRCALFQRGAGFWLMAESADAGGVAEAVPSVRTTRNWGACALGVEVPVAVDAPAGVALGDGGTVAAGR